jgi:ferrous iron transport protein B
VLRRRLPTVVVVNMMDLAEKSGVHVNVGKLAAALGCEAVGAVARSGQGIEEIRHAIRSAKIPTPIQAVPGSAEELRHWAEEMYERAVPGAAGEGDHPPPDNLQETRSDRADRVLLHPVLGAVCFALVMTGLFYTIFSLAQFPMGWIESVFAWGTALVEGVMPEGALRELLTGGVLGGVGSTLVFLPQICLLFFLISLLEDTGYLARGAFLMDRLLRPFGLPGQAFVPLLSSHACALPGIMATRGIPDAKERLATILVAPFMTCSARLPVYVLLTSILFAGKPMLAALAFVGCYALGIVAGVLSALIARRTILRGRSRPMAMELPSYKWPSVRTAFITTIDRGLVFVKKAGTVILAMCIVLWWLGAYPKAGTPIDVAEAREKIAAELHGLTHSSTAVQKYTFEFSAESESREAAVAWLRSQTRGPMNCPEHLSTMESIEWESERIRTIPIPTQAEAESMLADKIATADRMQASFDKKSSFLGAIGQAVQPVFAPLGYDWQLTVGVMASFAAREVFVSTMSVVITGTEDTESDGIMDQLAGATRSDTKTLVFSPSASWSLLVFFVLAMQCLPTLAVTARESGSVKWAIVQLVWMSGLAYGAALIVYQVVK